MERSPQGFPVDSFLRSFWANKDKQAYKRATKQKALDSGMTRVEIKYYCYNVEQEEKLLASFDNNPNVESLKDELYSMVRRLFHILCTYRLIRRVPLYDFLQTFALGFVRSG